MATIYNVTNGTTITDGLDPSEALRTAQAIAAERDEDVHLVDDGEEYLVHPDGGCTHYVDPDRCDALRREAAIHGDLDMVAICRAALRGDATAIAQVAIALRSAAAMDE